MADFFVGSGLTAGLPWTFTVSFDPGAPPIRTLFPGCNQYSVGATTMTLGAYSYTHSSGSIYTNAALPEIGCFGALPEGLSGNVTFWYGNSGWHTDDPGAPRIWNWGGITYAAYYDQLVKDGTLPVIPTFDPLGGWFQGFEIENNAFLGTLLYGGSTHFQLVDPQPSPVPEPATLLMVGAGLTWIARRRMRS